jgi:hypothetical protein
MVRRVHCPSRPETAKALQSINIQGENVGAAFGAPN